jgi:hypothetical protein
VKNKPYTELISKEQFNKIKESIKKWQSLQQKNNW